MGAATIGDGLRRNRGVSLRQQHARHHERGARSRKVFECVAAHGVTEEIEYLAVEMLQNLRQAIPYDHPNEIATSGVVVSGKQPADGGQCDHRVELHKGIEPKIATPQQLGPVPVNQAGETRGGQREQHPAVSRLGIDAVGDDRRAEGHEPNRHR